MDPENEVTVKCFQPNRSSEVAYNDTRGHGQFKATCPERKAKKGVALLP